MPAPFVAASPAEIPAREVVLSMSGFDFVRGMIEGRLPQPTISRLMGFRLVEAEPGRVRFVGQAGFQHTNPFGAVHGGWYGTALDSALGCSVMTVVPQGRWYTTLEYKVNLTRALPLDMEVEVVGTVDHAGRSTAVAHAELRGIADGRLYATGSTTCIILS